LVTENPMVACLASVYIIYFLPAATGDNRPSPPIVVEPPEWVDLGVQLPPMALPYARPVGARPRVAQLHFGKRPIGAWCARRM
jgi:hypothetical protein